ncbi:DegT/DnrJ/EryC1/StrS family aminotransferase [Psychromonas sp. KJ10-10]|uniref:DegT/DnrJ/EryC1/StrS family aminotransferase n=1 Tax=Psychromonas sp. KJ10-10 TaxID=3391823 RepID=UPI0039B3779E
MIHVTKTYLPNKDKYHQYIDEIFESGWVTNHGKMVQRLEKRLATYLNVKNIVLVANGTVALETAYRALEIKGHVITTPFSFVATTSSLVTNGLTPIFADINPSTLNINPKTIEATITKDTTAIVPVHIFGNGCEVEEIQHIANKNRLKVIYDASHAFDVQYKEQNILNYGDISTLSFHATKLFHTIEGGALIVNDETLLRKIRYLINFGIQNEESIVALGTNAKMNEFEVAMGLCVLDEMEQIKAQRKSLYRIYEKGLNKIVQLQTTNKNASPNYSYFPIILKDHKQMINVKNALNNVDIFPRRYFFPSLDSLNYIKPEQFMPISRDICSRILCLPLYPDLSKSNVDLIIKTIIKTLQNESN